MDREFDLVMIFLLLGFGDFRFYFLSIFVNNKNFKKFKKKLLLCVIRALPSRSKYSKAKAGRARFEYLCISYDRDR